MVAYWFWTSQKLSSYFIDLKEIKKDICHTVHDNLQDFFYIIICENLFLPVRTHFHLCFLCARIYFHLYAFVWMLKHQKYWYFFLLKTLWHESFLTESWKLNVLLIVVFITITILQQNHGCWPIFQLRTFKTQILDL